MSIKKNTHCDNCGDMVISDLDDFDKDDLVNELAYRSGNSADWYIAESINEKLKLELFIELVDKFTFTEFQERLNPKNKVIPI